MTHLVNTLMNSSTLVDSMSPLPPYPAVLPVVQNIHRSLFAILLSLSTDIFPQVANTTTATTGTVYNIRPHVFMNSILFVLAIIILALNLLITFIYYIQRPPRFLPQFPTSIASAIAYVAAATRYVNGKTRLLEREQGCPTEDISLEDSSA